MKVTSIAVSLALTLLFLAGASLPFNHLREVASQPYQGGTYLFVSFLIELLHRQN